MLPRASASDKRETFVEKETDETGRLGHRQCAGEQGHRLVVLQEIERRLNELCNGSACSV
jgi:hypothetical protein